MAFGATLTLTVNAVAKVLNRINQDNYGSEYYLRSTLDEYRVRIRHTKLTPNVDGKVPDSHNIEVTHTVFATSTVPAIVRQAYIVVRIFGDDDLTLAGYLLAAATTYFNNGTVQSDLLTWQS
ncbi:MAG: putative coat protein [Garnievirus montiscola]|uniref:Coat protein n=1 Tax=Leviviridae sp. TaxID=2027243 RepID=A0ABY3SVH9_9VIRU|nr:MAG: putative coat protein [Leviviridae sp.]